MEPTNKLKRPISYWAIYPKAQNRELAKDLGVIPHFLASNYGYDSYLLTYKNGDYPWKRDVPETKLVFLSKRFGEALDVLLFLFRNAREIDVLHVEHLHNNANLLYGFLYKICNPHGILYYKLDASPYIMEQLVNRRKDPKSRLKTWFLQWMMHRFIDLVSVEAKNNHKRLISAFFDHRDKILHLPNGFYVQNAPSAIAKKKNIIFTAGRLGAIQKATEVLIEGFALVEDPGDWRLLLAGPVEDGFQVKIDALFDKYPKLLDRVDFLGYITDRATLYQFYGMSKIFCFPSRWEGFSHALIEAAFFSNYIIATDVGGAADVIEVTNYGRIVPFENPMELALALQQTIQSWAKIERQTEDLQTKVINAFSWTTQCRKLHEKLKALLEH
jgi:glycosyltransferase involved in cell wall biosynthesis